MKNYCIILIFGVLFCNSVISQSYRTAGGFLYKYYNIKSYKAHPRNFSIMQDKNEIMYFGNAYGVIEYDGVTWRNHSLPNGNSAVSLTFPTNDGKIFLSSYNDFGFLFPDSIGKTIYKSLSHLIAEAKIKQVAIESIHNLKNSIFLNTYQGIYAFKQTALHPIPGIQNGVCFPFVKEIKGALFIQNREAGLKLFDGETLHSVEGGTLLKNMEVKDLIESEKSKLLLVDKKGILRLDEQGLHPLNTVTNKILSECQLNKLIHLQNGNWLVTTYSNGFYILTPDGDVLNNINRGNGFPGNVINAVYIDRRGGVWFALDNGIVFMELNSPFTYIGSEDGIQGLGYAAALFGNKLYLGTSEGVYCSDWNSSKSHTIFTRVQGINGPVWNLSVIGNTLFCDNSEHLYIINGNVSEIVSSNLKHEGSWKITSLHGYPEHAIEGTYSGFYLYRKENGKWKFLRKLEGFDESSRVFVQDKEGNLWVCHGNKGIYKVTLSKELKIVSVVNYNVKNSLPPDFFNDVSYWDERLIFSSDEGFYMLDKKEKFVKLQDLEKVIGKKRYINRFTQCNDKTNWIFSGDEVLFFNSQVPEDVLVKQNAILKRLSGSLVGSFEFVMPVSGNKVIFGSQEGFILFDWKREQTLIASHSVRIRSIVASLYNDSLLYAGNSIANNVKLNSELALPYALNSIRISFASTWYMNGENVLYQYSLSRDNSSAPWSGWIQNHQVDFSNLREGNYLFKVRAKNEYGGVAKEAYYHFSIKPPWFRAIWAYAAYICILLSFIIVFYKFLRRRFTRQRILLEEQKQKELEVMQQIHMAEKLQAEKELMMLRTQKLEGDMIIKKNELASLAASLAQKTELLNYLKLKLSEFPSNNSSVKFNEIVKTIDQNVDLEEQWAKFQKHFDEIHFNFLHRLREKYPKLSPSWLLLCAYIKMNKSNKEIASLLNITVAGVEKRKYRLREKLEMDNDNKLSDFIFRF